MPGCPDTSARSSRSPPRTAARVPSPVRAAASTNRSHRRMSWPGRSVTKVIRSMSSSSRRPSRRSTVRMTTRIRSMFFHSFETADVVCLGHASAMEDQVDGAGVVLDVQPVADVFAPSVDGQRPAVTDVVDEERNQLFGQTDRGRSCSSSWSPGSACRRCRDRPGRSGRSRLWRLNRGLCGLYFVVSRKNSSP